jgi:hypothetical protein
VSCEIYTVGDGKRTQCARREDGVWFVRSKWHGLWGAWREHGSKCPYEFGKYLAPHAGKARLPNGT